tara:strand:+ start:942 stop:1976 length:1035 start_codon:yes stop_codon:yes gene_type:complete
VQESFSLSIDNATDYCKAQGLVAPKETLRITELTGSSVSNCVLLVTTSSKQFVLKQPYKQLLVSQEWFIDRNRIWREVDWMRVLSPKLGEAIPRIVFVDKDNFICGMTYIGPNTNTWKELLFSGQVNPKDARNAGELLGTIHKMTSSNPGLSARFPNDHIFIQGRVSPYFDPLEETRPELSSALATIRHRLTNNQIALVHGDFSPKNILVSTRSITVIDAEICHFGDPAFDTGFLISHILLKYIHRSDLRPKLVRIAQIFWNTYLTTFDNNLPYDQERATCHIIGALLAARIDGKSPAEYIISSPEKEVARKLSGSILLEPIDNLEMLLELAQSAVTGSQLRCH